MTRTHPPIAALLILVLISVAAAPLDELKSWFAHPQPDRPDLTTQPFASASLTKSDAAEARKLLWADHLAQMKQTRQAEWDAKAITIGDKTLKLKTKFIGQKPPAGWNLFISMHGGGSAPAAVNDSQWENQIKLYSPKDSLYIAPRAPTDNWNLWHESHIDLLFNRLIEDAIALADVNPDRVYLMGYSAGGDGVYQLAPRMADHWAAASMMAGHPNDASPLSLRDLPFTIHVGALDTPYHRNDVAAEWSKKLNALQQADPTGYTHLVKLHAGKAHWMDRDDAEAIDWMLKFTRDPLPKKIVWFQSPVTHDRFYWLAVPKGSAKKGQQIIASRDGQTIDIEKADGISLIILLLDDRMLDLDKPFTVRRDGKVIFEGKVARNIASLANTIMERGDPGLIFAAQLELK